MITTGMQGLLLVSILAVEVLAAPAAFADQIHIADGDTEALLAAMEAAGPSGETTVISLASNGHYEWPDTGSRIALDGNVMLLGNGAAVTVPYNDQTIGSPLNVLKGATYQIRDLAWNGTFLSGPWLAIAGSLSVKNVTFSGTVIPANVVTHPFNYEVRGALISLQDDSAVLSLENVSFDLMFALNESISFPGAARALQIEAGSASLNHVTLRGMPDFGEVEGGPSYTMIGLMAGSDGFNPDVVVSNSIIMIHVPDDPNFVNVASLPCSVAPGTLTSLGGNLSNRNSAQLPAGDCGFETTIDYEGAGFGTFGDHGGPVPTLSLRGVSPAINAGADAYCLPADARGYMRGAACDAGAFEFGAALVGGGLGEMGAGGYWNEPGTQGFLAVSFPDTEMALLVWSTFDLSGNPTTVYGVGDFVDDDTIVVPQAAIDLPVTGSNPVQIEPVEWGTLTLDLESCSEAHLSYQTTHAGFTSGEQNLNRLTFFGSVGCSELVN